MKQVARFASQTMNYPLFEGHFLQNTIDPLKRFKQNPVAYEVCDLDNQIVIGLFYKEELIPEEVSGLYDIGNMKQKGNKCEIEYLNYQYSEPKWVNKFNIEGIN